MSESISAADVFVHAGDQTDRGDYIQLKGSFLFSRYLGARRYL
jgi:hypothetical protein